MGSEWRKVTIQSLIKEKIITGHKDGNYGSLYPRSSEFGTEGVPFLTAKSLSDGRIDIENAPRLSDEKASKLKIGFIETDDVLLSHNATVGRVAVVPELKERVLIGTSLTYYRLDQKRLLPRYLAAYFTGHGFQNELAAAMSQTTRNQVPITGQRKLPVVIPPLPEQKAIAHILGSLDDKIELNRRMNATLEEMAQALFKSWFVDFDPMIDNALEAGNPIPEELTERAEVRRQTLASGTANREAARQFPASFQLTEELGWIPEGWEVLELENTTSAIIDHRGKTPKKLGSDWVESGYPAVSAKNIKDGKIVRKDTIRFIDPGLYERWMSEKLQKGDLLMTSEAPLGEKLYLAKQFKWVLSQRLFALRANGKISGVYLYHWLNTATAIADIDGRASGTTVQGIRQRELRKVKVLVPLKDCITVFSEASDSLMAKRATNEENTEELTKLRDTLLPKLISGEMRVPQQMKSYEP